MNADSGEREQEPGSAQEGIYTCPVCGSRFSATSGSHVCPVCCASAANRGVK